MADTHIDNHGDGSGGGVGAVGIVAIVILVLLAAFFVFRAVGTGGNDGAKDINVNVPVPGDNGGGVQY